jgi:YbbR domain-containing protein
MRRPNVGLIVASMVVSVLLWLQVRSEAALQTSRKIDLPLRYVNLDEERYVVRSLPKSVAAQVEGTAEQIDRFTSLKAGTVVATVDLSDANPEITTYRVRLPRSEAIQRTGADLRALSDDIIIIIEEVAIKESPVTIDPYNAPAGLMFSTAEVTPEKVRLRGPMGDLARVDQIRARFDLSLSPGRAVTVPLEILDKNQRPLEAVRAIPPEVSVVAQLAKVAPTKSIIVSVVFAGGSKPAPGYRLVEFEAIPPIVSVSGEMNLLTALKSLNTEAIRLDGLMQPTTMRVRLTPPRGLSLDKNTVDVRLKIEKIPEIDGPPVVDGDNP